VTNTEPILSARFPALSAYCFGITTHFWRVAVQSQLWNDWTWAPGSSTPDLFSVESPVASANPPSSSPAITSSRYVLPKELPSAIRQLGDQEFDLLLSAVLAEQKRRAKVPDLNQSSRKRRIEVVSAPLTQGKLNAVRAAFKAGVTPSRIARQFGISQSDVRTALIDTSVKR
jgi:hypothetical protein